MARKASEKPAAKAPKTAPEKAEVKLQEAAAALTAEVKAEEKKAKAPAKRASKPKAPKQEAPKAEKPEAKAEKTVKEAKPKAKEEAKPAQKKEEKIVESKPETKPEPQPAKVEQPQPQPASKAQAAPAKKKILFVTSEAAPYVKTGGLGEVAAALPKALVRKGYDVRVVLPLYFNIPGEFRRTMQYLGCCYVSLAWRYQYCGVFTHM